MFSNICVLRHPNHFLAFDIHVCKLQPSSFWGQDLQNYKQLMPLVLPKGIDNYKIFNNTPKFHDQHCISMYKFILLYLGQFCNSHMTYQKKKWSSLDYRNCKWDLNHALDIFAKKMKKGQHNSSNISWKLFGYTLN